jgi:aspartyl-tRNA(Asn)/glutamyl-tRNA(Gln) amidotransferase subunit A
VLAVTQSRNKVKEPPVSAFAPYATIVELARALRAGSTTPTALAEQYLERIERLNGRLGAFKRVMPERAMAQAKAAEAEMSAGIDRGPLHGIPYAAKDLYDVAGVATTAGCPLLESNIAERDGAVIRKLNDAGAVLLGKTVTVQFAYGGAGINNQHGTPHNPWQREPHLPGGSSSGSAVAVASGMVPMALGSDTGGSVRIPAALCGISGLKTTVGQISRAGVFPLSWSLDTVGPLTRTAQDAALS